MSGLPMRRCVGCGISKPKSELIRIVYYNGELSVDLQGRAKGRGVYLCRDDACLEKAYKKKGIQRSLMRDISSENLSALRAKLQDI